MRESGVLLPVFSLPSNYGIGCFSTEAYDFIRKLKEAGQKKWQVLPLGPTGFGDSPYQSFSTFAGNPYFIDLGPLIDEGLVAKEECDALDFGNQRDRIDYEKMYHSRFKILDLAHRRFERNEEYDDFVAKNSWWLEDYALFMALKDKHKGASWDRWDLPYKNRDREAIDEAKEELKEQIESYQFQQFYFAGQWQNLRRYANENGVKIIGDIPIYVAFDSADTWANPELFQFDENKEPICVAGCPPDYFSEGGQLWGNPLYDWEYHKKTGFRWWFKRMNYTFTLFDVVRIDHFRGFDEYYSIPYGREDAKVGEWLPGPGIEFFNALKEELGQQRIIAEDLGLLTESVMEMLEESGYPGMKVLQFAFDSEWDNNYLPHTYPHNCVVYTGTHDNETTKGWMEGVPKEIQNYITEYLGREDLFHQPEGSWEFIRMAMSSVADLCIIPLQDYLSLGNEARINTPSTLGENWSWRLEDQFTSEVVEKIRRMTELYGR